MSCHLLLSKYLYSKSWFNLIQADTSTENRAINQILTMAYDTHLAERITRVFADKKQPTREMKMMGGLEPPTAAAMTSLPAYDPNLTAQDIARLSQIEPLGDEPPELKDNRYSYLI